MEGRDRGKKIWKILHVPFRIKVLNSGGHTYTKNLLLRLLTTLGH